MNITLQKLKFLFNIFGNICTKEFLMITVTNMGVVPRFQFIPTPEKFIELRTGISEISLQKLITKL
jgi:hypothetical protein